MLTGTINLGKIFGIEISVDYSWFIIFLLITGDLGLGVFPALHPGWGPLLNWGISLAASVLFFASVLAHELAHSLVAKAQGINVSRIILFIFGGISNITQLPPSPGAEFLMAVVGPITSIILGVIFVLISGITGISGTLGFGGISALSALSPIQTLFAWLGPVNLLVGIFNLIPGFPLDGGRILRSIIWAITGKLKESTQIASTIGQIVAWAFIIMGVAMVFGISIPVFGSGIVNGIWLAFIGFFLNSAASGSYQQLLAHDRLEKVSVSKLMQTNVATASEDTSVGNLVEDYIMGQHQKAIPITKNGSLEGLVCLEDVSHLPSKDWNTKEAGQIMTPANKLDTVSPNQSAADALGELASSDVNQIPVVQNGKLVGLISRRDIITWLQLGNNPA